MPDLTTLREMAEFFSARKKLWLLPIVLVVLFIGVVAAITSSDAVAPLIYTLF